MDNKTNFWKPNTVKTIIAVALFILFYFVAAPRVSLLANDFARAQEVVSAPIGITDGRLFILLDIIVSYALSCVIVFLFNKIKINKQSYLRRN